MSNPGEIFRRPAGNPATGPSVNREPAGHSDAWLPLANLESVKMRMDSLQTFLSQSVNNNTLLPKDQMDMVSSEISAAIHQVIVNGAALLTCAQNQLISAPLTARISGSGSGLDVKREKKECNNDDDENDEDCEIVELDSVELLAEHIHFCDICGKGFKRDANLRMHMRAHGNQYKTPEALAKKGGNKLEESAAASGRKTRFSCPYDGCNRNQKHKRFRALKSVICVRNHFKRSHCPKMYSCNRCQKKSFSVLADLKSHLKHCGGAEEKKWRCSCGNSFSRKDKLFGHMALFEGHMPAVANEDEEEKSKGIAAAMEEDEEKELEMGEDLEDGFYGLLDGFDPLIDNFSLQDVLSPRNGL